MMVLLMGISEMLMGMVMKMMMMLLIRGAIFRLELSGRPSKFNTDSMWPIYWSDNTEDNMQMMICCISKGHKIYESIQAHTSNAHIAMH